MDETDASGGIDELPAGIEARRQVLRSLRDPAALVESLESDPALLLRVLRAANARAGCAGTVGSAAQAVAALGADAVAEVVMRAPVQHPLRAPGAWGELPQRYVAHVESVRTLVVRLRRVAGSGDPGELTAAVLLHDIGRLALSRAEPAYGRLVDEECSPEDRLCAERAAFGLDHAELGGWLARRWRLPERLAIAIEEHHGASLGTAALVRVADMLVHAREGRAIDVARLSETVAAIGVAPSEIRSLAFEAV